MRRKDRQVAVSGSHNNSSANHVHILQRSDCVLELQVQVYPNDAPRTTTVPKNPDKEHRLLLTRDVYSSCSVYVPVALSLIALPFEINALS